MKPTKSWTLNLADRQLLTYDRDTVRMASESIDKKPNCSGSFSVWICVAVYPSFNVLLAGSKRRSFSAGTGGLISRVFGNNNHKSDEESKTEDPTSPETTRSSVAPVAKDEPKVNTAITEDKATHDEKTPTQDKKRRSSSASKAKDIFTSARHSLNFGSDKSAPLSPMQKLTKADPALGVPQGSLNNSAGESHPGPNSTFRVGVTEDKNKKCRRTMEDTHAYLYNFLSTPRVDPESQSSVATIDSEQVVETDNGYFAIFDGHAGTFAAEWCGKKLHLLLEDTIRKHPNTPIPELLDSTFTTVDKELEKLPLKNSGCTAITAVLRWEDRVPNPASATGSAYINQAAAKEAAKVESVPEGEAAPPQGNGADSSKVQATEAKLRGSATRQRVLYTANVGDARIVLCRNGRALRLSYDHKGSDESEGRRIANAGGLILNNRVNGVLAVTRALGDTYMKDLVTGHPYTTETVIQPDQDEFLILACDGLWDVCTDQEAVDLIRNSSDPQAASKQLVEYALTRFSTDNLSCMVVRFDNKAVKTLKEGSSIGVEGDNITAKGGISEADAIVSEAKKLQEEDGAAATDFNTTATPETIQEEAEDTKAPPLELNPAALKAAKKTDS
ncbi:PP2C-domain-containing protein [Microthyrium microscopicum]|uniref:PP2C-domain-containing protein n=1 Tax=Microthyrium microscopicum TaxID=703497 RepID=A0A6A6UDG0_9PEZI|nr:PP2C-domain-containing protein [Microthyrium microscopicum]